MTEIITAVKNYWHIIPLMGNCLIVGCFLVVVAVALMAINDAERAQDELLGREEGEWRA